MADESKTNNRSTRIDLLQLATSLARLVDPEQAYDELLELTTHAFDAGSGQIIFCDMETGRLQVRVTSQSLKASEQTFSTTVLAAGEARTLLGGGYRWSART